MALANSDSGGCCNCLLELLVRGVPGVSGPPDLFDVLEEVDVDVDVDVELVSVLLQ